LGDKIFRYALSALAISAAVMTAPAFAAVPVSGAVTVMGAALMAEYEDVLGRTSLFKRCRLNVRERDELLDIFLATCRWTRIYFGWRPNLKDEADNHLIELAIAGGASKVVTANVRDFVRAELLFPRLQVLTAAQLLRETKPQCRGYFFRKHFRTS
jgi:predicted nucleic acid-binding protein